MNSNWKKVMLGDVVTFQRGHDLSYPEMVKGDVPVVGSNGIIGWHNKRTTKGPSLVIGRSGNIGTPAYIKTDFWAHNTTLYVKEFHNSDPKFVYYLLQGLKLDKYNSGSAVPSLNRNIIHPIEVSIPPLQTQKSIADILSPLDDKIELLREQNKTLEAIAQALFKRWFVEFEFPDENGNPYKSSGGKMIDSELGEIPEGWRVYELKDLVSHLKPGTNYQPERQVSGIPFVNGRNVKNGFLDLTGVSYITLEEYERVHKTWKPEANDILITRIGTLGNVGVIRDKDMPLAVHYNSILIKGGLINYRFIYFLLNSEYFQEKYHVNKKQAVQEFVTIESVESIKLAFPDNLVKAKFLFDPFDNLFYKFLNNQNEMDLFVQIRDLLLPKLMKGEIEV